MKCTQSFHNFCLNRRDQALSEKEELAAEFLLFRRELQTTKEGTAVKEIRSLKTIIKHLEEDLMNERNKHQKSSSKRSQAYRNLLDEVGHFKHCIFILITLAHSNS